MGGAIRISVFVGSITLLVAAGFVPGGTGAAGAADLPPSFSKVARTALAASIVVRGPEYPGEAAASPDSDLPERELTGSRARRASGVGAGVIVDPRGFALASARVVGFEPRLEVALVDGTPLEASVVGIDWRTDIAVLRVRSEAPLSHLPLTDSEHVRIGDWIVAVGVPSGLAGTVTAGVITGLPAPAEPNPLAIFLQTDASLGPGFAGGPLVTMSGKLVGLATAIRGAGIGYALPATSIRKIYVELLEKGRVSRPWLGVMTQRLSADLARIFGTRTRHGVLIADVLPGSPAAAAGLRSGDVVLEINGYAPASRAQFERTVGLLSSGTSVRLKIRRATRDLVVSVRLGEEPDEWEVRPDLIRARRLLGIEVRPVTPAMGAVVVEVDAESPADLVGIEPGDVIREIDRKPVRDIKDFQTLARRAQDATEILLLVQRADIAVYVVVRPRPHS